MVDRVMSAKRDEEPVKRWELREVQNQVTRNEKVGENADAKLDQIIQLLNTRPTTAEVDAKIELAVKNAIEKQDLKYAPIVSNNKLLLSGVIITSLGLMASLIMLIVTQASKGQI